MSTRARKNKIRLMDVGKSVADLARELQGVYGGKLDSLWTMVDNMIKDRDYYPRYAIYLSTHYGFDFRRPDHKRSSKELLKHAA